MLNKIKTNGAEGSAIFGQKLWRRKKDLLNARMPAFLQNVVFDEMFFLVPMFFWQTSHLEVLKMGHVLLHLLEQKFVLDEDYQLVKFTNPVLSKEQKKSPALKQWRLEMLSKFQYIFIDRKNKVLKCRASVGEYCNFPTLEECAYKTLM